MYPQIFSAAKDVDHAFLIILGFSIFILVVITLAMIWFLFRYNKKRNPIASKNDGNIWAEIIWTGLPLIIVMGLFWTGWKSFKAMRTIPDGAMVVQAEGRMWSWKFTYANGKTSKELYIPLDKPVKLELSAKDVIHSFYIPAMRVKWDMVPGMDTDAWIQSDTLGDYDIFCSEYCGLKHADMITLLHVLPEDEFEAWVSGATEKADVKPQGLALLEEYGCFDCHAMDGSADAAPPLNDLAGRKERVTLPDGTKTDVIVDASYIKESMLHPGAALAEGFGDEMPPYEGDMSDEDASTIANYLMGMNESGEPLVVAPHPGAELADVEGCTACHSVDGTNTEMAPTFKGLFGSTIKVKEDGKEVSLVVDEAYIKESILHVSAKVREGYDDAMPSYEGMQEKDIEGLTSYIKSLGVSH